MPYEEQVRELGMYNLEESRAMGDMIAAFNYVKGRHVEEGANLFTAPLKDQEQRIQITGEKVPLKQQKAFSDGEGCL